jgi:hypothetical protein
MPRCQHPPDRRVYRENNRYRYDCSACGAKDRACAHPPSAKRWLDDQSGYDCLLCGKPVRHSTSARSAQAAAQQRGDQLPDAAARASRARARALDRLRRKHLLEYVGYYGEELKREEMKAGLRPVPLLSDGEFASLRQAVAARYATVAEQEKYSIQVAERRKLGRPA